MSRKADDFTLPQIGALLGACDGAIRSTFEQFGLEPVGYVLLFDAETFRNWFTTNMAKQRAIAALRSLADQLEQDQEVSVPQSGSWEGSSDEVECD